MSLNLSITQLLDNLERRIAFHRDQTAMHARQTEHHREQQALHEAELDKVVQHYESLKALMGAVKDLALALPPGLSFPEGDSDLGPKPKISKLAYRVIQGKPDGETFGLASVTAEINSRFRDRLKKPADRRTVSAALRRLCQRHSIQLVQEGRASHEAVYTKGIRVAG
ncbi:MAG TPA: hypothetical protein VN493_13540 [Thermoanaerobaculia bacterium]|nr:hypothetical protein [Thermoanaerobaculia bacterium]